MTDDDADVNIALQYVLEQLTRGQQIFQLSRPDTTFALTLKTEE